VGRDSFVVPAACSREGDEVVKVSTVGFESTGSELEALETGGTTGSLTSALEVATGTGSTSAAGVAGGSCF
jgi:hypothetical protein